MGTRHILHTLTKQSPNNEVRHLVLHLVNGSHETILSQITNCAETKIATGTEYDMRQEAITLAQTWATEEGFVFPREGVPVFDSLKNTVALAVIMGHTLVYDPNLAAQNVTGAVPLTRWPGMTAKNGGGYEYAYDGLKIIARPTLPPGHGLDMAPTKAEFIAVMQKATALLATVGPMREFLLGGGTGQFLVG